MNLDRIIFLAFVVGAFFAGMRYENISMTKDQLNQDKIVSQLQDKQDKAVNEVANRVLNGLSEWEKNKEVVLKEMHYETTKPVFYNVCSTDEYVRMFNQVQDSTRKTLTGKSNAEVQK